ncbi:MAG TPA: aspartyl protease family protein [Blastocatellia bacterium]|nr:aspartyl protease family protein [Blastocatellia bacterium]
MTYQLNFEKLLTYDAGDAGINLDVTLKLAEHIVGLTAKVDTGASCCIFERRHGEQLGVAVEQGMRQLFGTATGEFLAYGHEVTLRVAGLEFDSVVFFAADEQIRRSVLGRFGWLDRVVLGLVDYEGKLYLNSYEGEE